MAAGVAYAKRYGAGFTNGDLAKPVDDTFLNAVEAALLQLIGSAPTADGQVAQWDFANTRFGPALILNKNIDPAAAIAKSKLDLTGANGIVNADVAAAAAIATSKLANPADVTKVLRGDGTYGYASTVTYRKNTPKSVTNSVAATDLLNGEITIAANALSATGHLRIKAFGTCSNATGSAQNSLRLQLLLGGTTIIDTAASTVTTIGSGGGALPWELEIDIIAAAATNVQTAFLRFEQIHATSSTTAWVPATGVGINIGAVENSSGYAVSRSRITAGGTKDMTVAEALVLNVINPVASANFTTTLTGARVEVL